jgi:adenylylsulfate kinase-like enzyme
VRRQPDPEGVPVLIITGPIGAGKTAVSHAVADRLRAAGIPHAMLDIDAIAECYPHPPDDRWNFRLVMKNLAALWRNFREAGATWLILNWVVESKDELEAYREAIPSAELIVVRLRAPVAVLEERVRRRATDSDLAWEIARSRELAEQMDATNLQDVLIETDGRSVAEVAEEIVARWVKG